jgi:hypothetical protein
MLTRIRHGVPAGPRNSHALPFQTTQFLALIPMKCSTLQLRVQSNIPAAPHILVKKQSRKDSIKCHIFGVYNLELFHGVMRHRQTCCITWEKSHKKNDKYS